MACGRCVKCGLDTMLYPISRQCGMCDYLENKKNEANSKCVMCNGVIQKEHESKSWAGSHEWCEGYY